MISKSERQGLVETLKALGPDAPTLCEGWMTKHLLAHLIMRETEPVNASGILLKGRQKQTQNRLEELSTHFESNLSKLLSGPPLWNPMRYLDKWVNALEMLIHHEDVLRAQPNWQPRKFTDSETKELDFLLKIAPRFLVRGAKVLPTLVVGDLPTSGRIILRGDQVDLLLFLAGRQSASTVSIEGDESDVADFMKSSFGI